MKKISTLLATSLAALATPGAQAAENGKCYVLAFSSGDETSAYQAGALAGIANSQLTADEFAYDSVSGISGGAINAVILSNFTKGEEKAAASRME